MTESKTPRTPRRALKDRDPAAAPAAAPLARCNLPGCGDVPEWRGLCSAHRQTHRGLANPKEDPRV